MAENKALVWGKGLDTLDDSEIKLLSNPKTLFLQQVFTNYLVYMPGTIPRDQDPTANKTNSADTGERLTVKLERQIINKQIIEYN